MLMHIHHRNADNLLLTATPIAAIEFRHEAEKDCRVDKARLNSGWKPYQAYLARKMQYNIDYLKMWVALKKMILRSGKNCDCSLKVTLRNQHES